MIIIRAAEQNILEMKQLEDNGALKKRQPKCIELPFLEFLTGFYLYCPSCGIRCSSNLFLIKNNIPNSTIRIAGRIAMLSNVF